MKREKGKMLDAESASKICFTQFVLSIIANIAFAASALNVSSTRRCGIFSNQRLRAFYNRSA